MRNNKLSLIVVLGLSIPALAGPPLVCHRIEIGNAKSLPWKDGDGWNGAEAAYDLKRLVGDTLGLLGPATPLKVRMETMRRAAIYSAKDPRFADELTARLLARALDAEAARRPDPLVWFDAGYFVESLRQAGFVHRFEMLSPAERAGWKHRGEAPAVDGYPWIRRAIELGGKEMAPVLAMVDGYRRLELQARK